MAEIPAEVLHALNTGQTASVNLVEFLATDPRQLLSEVATQIGIDPHHPTLQAAIARLPGIRPMQRHWAIAQALLPVLAGNADAESRLAHHTSDLARQWAALMIGLRSGLTMQQRLELIRPFAADSHFGVREMAWLALRNPVAAELPLALGLLFPWTLEADPNLRRFASELTRPRGVWCMHLEMLKLDPSLGLPLLVNLCADPSRYVQNSVANWLNDAAKSRPEWVFAVCNSWLNTTEWSAATRYICKRGMRSITAA